MRLSRRDLLRGSLSYAAAATLAGCQGEVEAGFDAYGGWTGLHGTKTGFYHLEEIGGRHWFVTPEGNVFFPVALSHLLSGDSKTACEQVYGGDREAWVRDSLAKVRAMGFNCALGGATSPERNLNGFVDVGEAERVFREAHFPFAAGVFVVKHPWEFEEGETLPDVFDPAFEREIEAMAEAVCPAVRDDPLVIGYYYGFGAFNRSQHWVNLHLSRPPGSLARKALAGLLEQRYAGEVAAFNTVYGTKLTSFTALESSDTLAYDPAFERRNFPDVRATLEPRQLEDFEAIVRLLAVRLYRIAHEAIRRRDTNHLIFGSFIKEWALAPETWEAIAPYTDVIAPQHLNREISIDTLAATAGQPAIMSDEYFGFYYPDGRDGHAGVKSHDARAELYRLNLVRHLRDPSVAGVTYCACMFDQVGDSARRGMQNGFYDARGNPRQALIDAVTRINHQIYEHAPSPASPEELSKLDRAFVDGISQYRRGNW